MNIGGKELNPHLTPKIHQDQVDEALSTGAGVFSTARKQSLRKESTEIGKKGFFFFF